MSPTFLYLSLLFGAISAVVSQFPDSVGVCNGRRGNDLPLEADVVELYKSKGIKGMRIYEPSEETLTALAGSDIQLILDVPNKDLQSLQSDATLWVQTNVAPHFPATKIQYIAVGNEVDPEKQETSAFAPLLLPAMQNIYKALTDVGLQNKIKVSTATYSNLLDGTYPPSDSYFKDKSFMQPIVEFLAQTGSPLLVNIYPYFAYVLDTSGRTKLEFALFTSGRVEYEDRGLQYTNQFDAMVDGVYYALEKVGGQNVGVVVSESGWPSGGGGQVESVGNADTYYGNLVKHVVNGTPRKQGQALETYLFAMFDENLKDGKPTEQHFGLFYPNNTSKYHLI